MRRGPRVGRVGLLAVAARGVREARKADWDVGMLRRAGRALRVTMLAAQQNREPLGSTHR